MFWLQRVDCSLGRLACPPVYGVGRGIGPTDPRTIDGEVGLLYSRWSK